jgi:ribulose-phosphate 3-epimerase
LDLKIENYCMSLVIPAILPSSRQDLEEKLELFSNIPLVHRVQIDVVDGTFASPASWPYFAKATQGTPYPELEAMVKKGEMLQHLGHFEYEIDLMCLDAEEAAEKWIALGASRLTFHSESLTNIPKFLASARQRFTADNFPPLVSFGLALNIASDLSLVEASFGLPAGKAGEIDYVQLMGIARIGRQGQTLDPRIFEKVRLFRARHPDIPLQVDGGISFENAKKLIALGVSHLVIGSALVRAGSPARAIEEFEKLQEG